MFLNDEDAMLDVMLKAISITSPAVKPPRRT
jgi:hypothetical protein